MKIKRVYKETNSSVLLLGPRGTGKSTFVKTEIRPDLTIDLLKSTEFRQLTKNPNLLEELVGHLKEKQTVFIDEVQKIPELLDEVHSLIENKNLRFILSGSSARKLKKSGANLLAGRAVSRKMYPFSMYELDSKIKIKSLIEGGSLPLCSLLEDLELVNEHLFSYVETYLKEEIQQEGLVRNVNEFSEFISMAGQMHGQILNYENIAKSIGKSGDTIKAWFQILYDTLLGQEIKSYSLNLFPKESKHSKFFLFDNGVARAAEGLTTLENHPERRGFYLENLILNEIKVYCEAKQKRVNIYYYNVPSMGDIDFIVEIQKKSHSRPAQIITFDIKHSAEWKTEFSKMSQIVNERVPNRVHKMIGIYLGKKRLTQKKIQIFPIEEFVKQLWNEDIF